MSVFALAQAQRAEIFAVFIPPLIVAWKLRKLARLSSLHDIQERKPDN
jgi:hypothetical protein